MFQKIHDQETKTEYGNLESKYWQSYCWKKIKLAKTNMTKHIVQLEEIDDMFDNHGETI